MTQQFEENKNSILVYGLVALLSLFCIVSFAVVQESILTGSSAQLLKQKQLNE